MRHSTTDPTVGSVPFVAVADKAVVEFERGIDMVGLLFLSAAGVVTVEPMMEAWILES